jgi:hypothetical protein
VDENPRSAGDADGQGCPSAAQARDGRKRPAASTNKTTKAAIKATLVVLLVGVELTVGAEPK